MELLYKFHVQFLVKAFINILINHAETEPRDGLYVLRIGNDLLCQTCATYTGQTACNV